MNRKDTKRRIPPREREYISLKERLEDLREERDSRGDISVFLNSIIEMDIVRHEISLLEFDRRMEVL